MDNLQERVAVAFEQESGRVLASLVARLHDVELAEDSLQDALVIALEHWPQDGIPHNPGAWITTAARNCAIDRLRRDKTLERKKAVL
ncbi:MAG TPA: sigma factor, partial [Aggregatilineales bacterium]|nr:sigma factor [Aggregatilineales bacterium]